MAHIMHNPSEYMVINSIGFVAPAMHPSAVGRMQVAAPFAR
jgi:hypothetical protein